MVLGVNFWKNENIMNIFNVGRKKKKEQNYISFVVQFLVIICVKYVY